MTEHHDVAVIGAGQSGLAAAQALLDHGLHPVVLEASHQSAGSWPHYYDSLTLFSPARHSALPGLPFPGEDPDRYPHRDEVTDYLIRYAGRLDADIRTRTPVTAVETDNGGFTLHTADGHRLHADGIVAATGSFANPHHPTLPGQDTFTGQILHVADYRTPPPYAGRRILVVGAGNSAVQIGHELAHHATVTLATHAPLKFLPQRRSGADLHHWLTTTGFDHLPPHWLAPLAGGALVLDPGRYAAALQAGRWHRRPMFTHLDGDSAVWADGDRQQVDVLLLATGYRPHLPYLTTLPGALDTDGMPQHSGGLSTTHPGLVYLGLEFQRSFASNTLRGIAIDAAHVIPPLAALIHKAPASIGL